jgi:hypothetical protein
MVVPVGMSAADSWYLRPWEEEAVALDGMRVADADDQGHEGSMAEAVHANG